VLQSYGLPSTFYDSQDDYRKFLELDVSPTELNDRAKVAQSTWLSTDQATKDVWAQWYGLSDGAAIAAILDPSKALPIIQSMAEAAKAGGVAVRNGLHANESRIRGYIDQGISGDKIAQGFSDIGAVHGTDQAIGSRFGINLDQATEEASRIQGLASARRAQAEAYGAEQALFDSARERGRQVTEPPHRRELLMEDNSIDRRTAEPGNAVRSRASSVRSNPANSWAWRPWCSRSSRPSAP
jgi:hypothetical protein